MKLLVTGGSGFIGPPMVRYAVERGHEVTIFTRGKTAAELPDVEQLIDVRDLDEWIIRLAEKGTYGTFNGVGLASPPSMKELLYGIRATTTKKVEFTWVSIPFLREHGVEPYSDMPIWTPADPLSAVDNSHAVASGLTFRPLAVTAMDTMTWHQSRPAEQQAQLRTGIKADRERKVLEAWHRHKPA